VLHYFKEDDMGFLEEAAAAAAALEAAKKLDPNAGIVTEGLAAFAGYEGAEKLEEHFENKPDETPNQG
jgi:hypothetical protein